MYENQPLLIQYSIKKYQSHRENLKRLETIFLVLRILEINK